MPGMASSGTALPLDSCIGFNGGVDGGLVLEKDGTTIIYPLGSTIIVRQLENDQQQTFLQGHTDEVNGCLRAEVSLVTVLLESILVSLRCLAWCCRLPGGTLHLVS